MVYVSFQQNTNFDIVMFCFFCHQRLPVGPSPPLSTKMLASELASSSRPLLALPLSTYQTWRTKSSHSLWKMTGFVSHEHNRRALESRISSGSDSFLFKIEYESSKSGSGGVWTGSDSLVFYPNLNTNRANLPSEVSWRKVIVFYSNLVTNKATLASVVSGRKAIGFYPNLNTN